MSSIPPHVHPPLPVPGQPHQQQQQQPGAGPHPLRAAGGVGTATAPQSQPLPAPPAAGGAGATATTTAVASPPGTPAASQLAGKVQHLFRSHAKERDPHEPQYGYALTEKLAQLHLQSLQQSATAAAGPAPAGPRHRFQVTKLRTWRTGYARVLALYDDAFATLDPDTLQETNRWPYRALTDWQALPQEPDTVLLQVGGPAVGPSGAERLKFTVHGAPRSRLLTCLLRLQDGAAQLPAADTLPVPRVERVTRAGLRAPVDLHVKPYGLVELSASSAGAGAAPPPQRMLQVYCYTDVLGCSLLAETGLVVTLRQPHKARLWLLPDGHVRSRVLTRVGEYMALMGLELRLLESLPGPEAWLAARRAVPVGTVAATWRVHKATARHAGGGGGSGGGGGAVAGLVAGGAVGGVVARELAVTGLGYLVERDGLGVVSVRKLSELVALIRHPDAHQLTLEYENGAQRSYTCSTRDALLVSILDAAATLGNNTKIHVSDESTEGYCLSSFSTTPTTSEAAGNLTIFQPISIPKYCLNRVHTLATQTFAFVSGQFLLVLPEQPTDLVAQCQQTVEACREFNASVAPTGEGLSDGAKSDKTVSGAVGALWGLVGRLIQLKDLDGAGAQNVHETKQAERIAAIFFQALFRLSHTPTGYKVSADLTSFQQTIPLICGIEDAFCKFWAFQVLNVLLSGQSKRDLETEYVNKFVIFKTGGQDLVQGIVAALVEPSVMGQVSGDHVSDLVLMAASDILQSVLCTYHDTTAPEHFNAFMVELGARYRSLLNTLRSQTPTVIENTALLLHLLSTHAPTTAAAIRDAALSSSILLQHFYLAVFSPLEGQRFLSRYLCSIWMSGPMNCDEKRLLKRMVPAGFLAYLNMPQLSPMEEAQLDDLEHDAAEENIRDSAGRQVIEYDDQSPSRNIASEGAGTNTGRLRKRIAIATATVKQTDPSQRQENFRIFFHVLTQDNNIPDLIWNQQTRRELRIALESEIQLMSREIESRGIDAVAWNHQQFRVNYPSLENEVKVGNVYMRLWLHAGDGFIRSWEEPLSLFELLFRKFLCEIDRDDRVAIMCIRCMERLYAIHAAKIGPLADVMTFVRSMASTKNIETQHRLLGFLATILGVSDDVAKKGANVPENAEQLLNIESIGLLCQFVAWGHSDSSTIGSLMSSFLSSGKPKLDMLEMSKNSQYQAQVETNSKSCLDDSGCPPVWFVATTGKIPPPTDQVRGPYRLSDLVRMVKENDLTPYHLVATTHVEEYDFDLNEAVNEAHIDTGKWKRLIEVWQLRWLLYRDESISGVYSPVAVALLALKSLTRLTELHRSLDSRGTPYFPIPMAKRVLCASGADIGAGARPLSILAQSLLCNNDGVVDQAADLLFKLLQYNDQAMSKIYLTGMFFFICCYQGNNFLHLARLLHSTHLKQQFLSGFAATAGGAELRMKDRSVLGNIIPEGLLFILVNYGFERFAEVFIGNVDTPEVIWTFEMRRDLIEMVRQHLGDFTLRLAQNNTAEYEYCPMPGIAYKRLQNEIFCHNYYLSNLCDEEKFPDWPIAEPVEVFRACLECFKRQIDRDEEDEEVALEKARVLLRLSDGDGTKELRKAYRSLARQYHPDKNPAGREMFESIQSSYELLLPVLESGNRIAASLESNDKMSDANSDTVAEGFKGGKSQMKTMSLLIKAQVLICRRFEKQMRRYKYPAYDILLNCLRIPDSCVASGKRTSESCLLHPERADFVLMAVELIFRSCLVSPPNGEEVVELGGVSMMSNLFLFYAKACCDYPGEVYARASKMTVAKIMCFIIRTLSGLAHFESGRSAMASLESFEVYISWLNQCLNDKLFPSTEDAAFAYSMRHYALEGIVAMAQNEFLQTRIIGAGVVWPLIRFALLYDSSAKEESTIDDDEIVISLSAGSTNVQASMAVRALGALSGAVNGSKLNQSLMNCLNRLLTVPLARMLRNKRTTELLRILSSSTESADIIWNESMRLQLLKTLDMIQKKRSVDATIATVDEELAVVQAFEFEALKDEIQFAGVYIRLFNKFGSEALNRIADPSSFFKAIISAVTQALNDAGSANDERFIKQHKEESNAFIGSRPLKMELDDEAFVSAVKCLQTLVQADGLLENLLSDEQFHGASVFVELLRLPVRSESFEIACGILSTVCSRRDFADSAATDGALWRLLSILERPEAATSTDAVADERMSRGWSFLEGLASSPSIAQLLLSSSGWLEILGVLVGYSKFTKVYTARIGAAKTLSRLMWDPTTQAFIAASLKRFLPINLVVSLKETPDAMIKQFDADSDTPELIWGAAMRTELRRILGEQLDLCIQERHQNTTVNSSFTLDPQVFVKYSDLEKELFIGGVYVSRFVKEPTFNLRDPNLFLESLLKRWDKELSSYTRAHSDGHQSECSAISEAGQDNLHLVTTAIVYLCKVRETLCDKLVQYGYMRTCVSLLPGIIENGLTGTPLLSVMRILHVASNRLSNVEGLALSGDMNGRAGIVDLTLQAIGFDHLHPECAFMIEFLNRLFTKAIGDVTSTISMRSELIYPAPSPAPGDGSVRQKVSLGDDPLAMMEAVGSAAPALLPQSTQTHSQQYHPQQLHQAPTVSASHHQMHQLSGNPSNVSYLANPPALFSQAHAQAQQQPPLGAYTPHGYPGYNHQIQQPSSQESHNSIRSQPQMQAYQHPTQTLPLAQSQMMQHASQDARQNPQPQQLMHQHHRSMEYQQISQDGVTGAYPHSGLIDATGGRKQSFHQHSGSHLPQNYGQPVQGQQVPAQHQPLTQPLTGGAAVPVPSQSHPVSGSQSVVLNQYPEPPAMTASERAISTVHSQSIQVSVSDQYSSSASVLARQAYFQQRSQIGVLDSSSLPAQHAAASPVSYMAPGAPRSTEATAGATAATLGQPSAPQTLEPPQPSIQYAPVAIEGTGIDARSAEDPRAAADRQTLSVGGARNAAQGRVALFQQALACELCAFLVEKVLENPKLPEVADPAAAKTQSIELLKVLTTDPGFGPKFSLILDGLPAWKKYKLQDHSLYVTRRDPRTDYFLTDGATEATKFITEK